MYVLENGEAGKDVDDLKGSGQAHSVHPVRREIGNVFSLKDHLSSVRRKMSRDDVEKGRLPSSIGPYNRGNRTLLHNKTDMLKRRQFSKEFEKRIDLEDVFSCSDHFLLLERALSYLPISAFKATTIHAAHPSVGMDIRP